MTVTFYNLSKRKNSTKQPTGVGTDVSVVLKENTSIEKPVLLLSGNTFNYNYAHISDFGRYYFVSDIVSAYNGGVEVHLMEDNLASAKTEIGNTKAYIAYASTGYNVDIIDPRIIARCNRAYQDVTSESSPLSDVGTFVLGLINDDPHTGFDNFGVVSYYVVSEAELAKFSNKLSDPTLWDSIAHTFSDPWQAVVSLTWFPYYINPLNGLANHVETNTENPLGTALKCYDTPVAGIGRKIYDPIIDLGSVSITIPYTSNDFRDASPFREFSLYLPGAGYTDISSADLYGASFITINTTVDIVHGDILYRILDGGSRLIKTVSINGSVNQPLAHATENIGGTLSSALGAVGGAAAAATGFATGNVILGATGLGTLGLSAVNTVLSAGKHSMSIKGSGNGKAHFQDTTFKLYTTVAATEDPDNADYIAKFGRPVGHVGQISNYSGYIQCESASIDIQGFEGEREEINRYLNSGFYYE